MKPGPSISSQRQLIGTGLREPWYPFIPIVSCEKALWVGPVQQLRVDSTTSLQWGIGGTPCHPFHTLELAMFHNIPEVPCTILIPTAFLRARLHPWSTLMSQTRRRYAGTVFSSFIIIYPFPKKFSSLYNACTQIILDRYMLVKVAHMQDHAS